MIYLARATLTELQHRRMVSLRLTAEARTILSQLAAQRGVSQAAVLELLLRDAVKRDEPEASIARRAETSLDEALS